MFIYIDESGSFVSAPTMGSWNVVVAVAVPEASRRAVEQTVRVLKVDTATNLSAEVKINEVTEIQYLKFLAALSHTHILLFATATDAGANQPDRVIKHQAAQVEKILENLPVMKYEGGRQGVQRCFCYFFRTCAAGRQHPGAANAKATFTVGGLAGNGPCCKGISKTFHG